MQKGFSENVFEGCGKLFPKKFSATKNAAQKGGIRSEKELLVFVFLLGVFTLLICDTAAGLASGLARGLAFAATAVLCAFAEILGIESLYTHDKFLRLF